MRSSELAQLAGVTVRTLRHYHTIGLMEEPSRSENGYRDYGTDDLVRLLRIKRLTALGFSLARIGEVLSEMDRNLASASEPNADAALDELDRELALQIERLEEQRRTIALLKRERLDPELPVRFARAAKNLVNSTRLTEGERKALLIAGHLYTESDTAELERAARALEERGLLDQVKSLQARYDALRPDATLEEIDLLVDETVELLDPVIDCFEPTNWEDEDDMEAWAPVFELLGKDLNPAERLAEERIMEELQARVLARKATAAEPSSTSSPQQA